MKTYHFEIRAMDMENAGSVSSAIKKVLKADSIDRLIIRRVAIASYEAEINVVIHSCGGVCDVEYTDTTLKINFIDDGPGIPDIEKAMQPGWSTASKRDNELGFGAGMGFVNMKNASDKLTVTSTSDGTNVEIFFNLRKERPIC